jgi:type II secretion system protein J
MSRQTQFNTRAFTLIEVMIAMAVFAIVMAAVNGIFWGALRLRNKSVESIDAALPKERALAIIRNDLANIVPPNGRFFTAFTTVGATTNAYGMAMNNMPGQNSPEFTTTGGVIDDNTLWGDVQRVAYQLQISTNNSAGKDLYRTVKRNLLPSIQQAGEQQPILSGVQSIFFFYHDGSIWKETWDSTNETLILPRAIKVQLQMASEERGRVLPPPLEVVVSLVDAGTNSTLVATQ